MRTQETIAVKIVHALLKSGEAQLWSEHCAGGYASLVRGQKDPVDLDTGIPTPAQALVHVDSCAGDDAIQTVCMAFGAAAEQRLSRILSRTRTGRETPHAAIEDVTFVVRWLDGEPLTATSIAEWLSEPLPPLDVPAIKPVAPESIRQQYESLVTRHASEDYHGLKAGAKRRLKRHIAQLEATYQF